jgi:hypothetical protein
MQHRRKEKDVSSSRYATSWVLVAHVEVVLMMSNHFASFTARKETLLERIGYVALDCPTVWSFGMTLGCNPPYRGRFQPLTFYNLIDQLSSFLSRGNCDVSGA